ncbi:hypothetical protein BLOT_007801 [Blomia tropicalis]|nr:hypothetical protein BLOT_007801 [Blomia tropicalis]
MLQLFLSPGSKSSVNESSNNNHSISNSVSNENRWSNHNDSLSSVIRSDVCGDENEDDDIDGQPITISMKLVNNNNNNDDNHHNQKDSSGNVTCDYIPLKTINE